MQERKVLEKMKGNNFISELHYAFQDKNYLYLILEYIQGEDLSKALFRKDRLKENLTKKYIAELIVVIEQLH